MDESYDIIENGEQRWGEAAIKYKTRDKVIQMIEIDDARMKEFLEKGYDSFYGKTFAHSKHGHAKYWFDLYMEEAKWRNKRAKYYLKQKAAVAAGKISEADFLDHMETFDSKRERNVIHHGRAYTRKFGKDKPLACDDCGTTENVKRYVPGPCPDCGNNECERKEDGQTTSPASEESLDCSSTEVSETQSLAAAEPSNDTLLPAFSSTFVEDFEEMTGPASRGAEAIDGMMKRNHKLKALVAEVNSLNNHLKPLAEADFRSEQARYHRKSSNKKIECEATGGKPIYRHISPKRYQEERKVASDETKLGAVKQGTQLSELPDEFPFKEDIAKMDHERRKLELARLEMFTKFLQTNIEQHYNAARRAAGAYDELTDQETLDWMEDRGDLKLVHDLMTCHGDE